MNEPSSAKRRRSSPKVLAAFLMLGMTYFPVLSLGAADDPGPPEKTAKLVFIHHSCGENWLADNNGGLGRALQENNYFVSDTNYGWGPNGIGDRTDIIDWPEWFVGPQSNGYLKALYGNSEQHSPYRRGIPDPGGENEVIMFKSCFPNSNLAGKPTDPPERGDGLTVGNAKRIYNDLLEYFSARPDKLFVAITAPPLLDPSHAANARAFNTWLVEDWLKGYRGKNVAVFDFYNVLTGPRNHHRLRNGTIEYITTRGKNTLYYPTGDDHPSAAGNRKATTEFVPLLNLYYHRWKESAPETFSPPAQTKTAALPAEESKRQRVVRPSPPGVLGSVIDDFESDAQQWEVFFDAQKETHLQCGRDDSTSNSGSASMRIEYDVASESWATCSLVYPSPKDWRKRQGLTVYLRTERIGQPVVIVAYQGESSDNLLHFEYKTEATQEAVAGWQRLNIQWDQLVQPPWQGESNVRFDPGRAMGLAFAFEGPEAGRKKGKLWVDDISFLSKEQ